MSLTQSHFIFQGVCKGTLGSLLKAIIPKIISVTSHRCVVRFKATRHGFPHMDSEGLGANQHENMLCFGGGLSFIFVGQKSHAMKHEPQNKNLET
jgi:hypothetical protein